MAHLPPSAQPKPGESKLQSVGRLITVLTTDLKTPALTSAQRTATLEQVKVHGRDPTGSDPIFTKEGIHTLCSYAFDLSTPDTATSREALRCIANALLLKEETRNIFVDLGYAVKAAEKFKDTVPDDEFLFSRILFLATYNTTIDLPQISSTGLPDYINAALTRHASSPITGMREMALIETLKLLFNLGHLTSDSTFACCLSAILTLLHHTPILTPPLQGVITHLINAPLSLDLTPHTHVLFPPTSETKHTARLIEILDASTAIPTLDEDGIPLITLLRKLLSLAPDTVSTYLKQTLLPASSERDAPLGTSATLPSRLLKLIASALAPNLKDHVAALLFELSDSNAETLVANIGYGYASGFLMSQGLQVSGGGGVDGVNPVTGQWVDREPQLDPFKEMTDEEKEREAERLFVLFERLKKTGVVDIKNPVQQAVEEGRFEEID